MKLKTFKTLQIVEYILKIFVWMIFIYWGYQLYLSMLSYDEVYSAPWYIELLMMTRLWAIIYVSILVLYHIIKTMRKQKGLPKFRIRYLFKVNHHPYMKIVFLLLIVLITLSFLIIKAQPLLLYHPNHSTFAYEKLMELDLYEIYQIEDVDSDLTYQGFGKINQEKILPTIIYFAGNGESSAQTFYRMYKEHFFTHFEDYQFIMIDYPGYGLSDGKTNDDAMIQMSEKVYEYVSNLDYVDQNNIYVYGYSIGTGVATYIASQYDVKGLILIAPYSNITDIFNAHLPMFKGILSKLVVEEFDSMTYAKDVDVSPLIIASKTDMTIPFELSEKLSFAFDDLYEFYVVDHTAHNEFLDKEDVILKIVEYLELP